MGACQSSSSKKILARPESFFQISEKPQNLSSSSQYTNDKVKLEFTIENCDIGQNYQVMAEFLNTKTEPFKTKTVKSHQNLIIFNSCYICDFLFQKPQPMRICIVKNGNIIGSITPYLGMIVGAPNSTYKIDICPGKKELISITAFGITNYNSFVLVNFLIRTNRQVDFSQINNKITYSIISNERRVYNSESISKDGQFKPARIPASLLEPNFDINFHNCRREIIVSRSETIKTFTEPSNRIFLSFNVNNANNPKVKIII